MSPDPSSLRSGSNARLVVYITTDHQHTLVKLVGLSGAALSVIGTGLFEANAIQFGMDQLLEAPM